MRSRIVLGAAGGQSKSNHSLAEQLGVSRPTVLLWRSRYRRAGVDGLLKEAPRPGRRKKIGARKVEAILSATLKTRPHDATHWSTRTMARAQGVSAATVRRMGEAHGLRPHRVKAFKLSCDQEFVGKLRDVVGLYLNPPDKAVVLDANEKSQIQALDRTAPVLPLRPGLPERQTHDYIRHGTTTLFAALNVLDGTVIGTCEPRPPARGVHCFSAAHRSDDTPPVVDSSGGGQLQHAQAAGSEAMVRGSPPVPRPLCSDWLLLAQFGGKVVCGNHPQANPPRDLKERPRADPGHHAIHPREQ